MANIQKKHHESHGLPVPGNWEPFRMFREMMRWDPFRDMGTFPSWEGSAYTPRFDLTEGRTSYVLRADLPGVHEKDLKVRLTENRLTVSGRRESEQKEEDEHHYMMERSFGTFSRTITLPSDVDPEKIQAELKEGILTLTLPKLAAAKAKEVEIKIK